MGGANGSRSWDKREGKGITGHSTSISSKASGKAPEKGDEERGTTKHPPPSLLHSVVPSRAVPSSLPIRGGKKILESRNRLT